MTKQAYKDENGHVRYREISDRKKCLTRQEFFKIVNGRPFQSHVCATGLVYANGIPYHMVSFNHWAGFPLILSGINTLFGRGIETLISMDEYPFCVLLIRAYRH